MIDPEHELASSILSLIPINNLGERQQKEALQAGELFEYKKKKVVFEAGSRDQYTYYLVAGDLQMESADASPLQVTAGSEQASRALAQLQPRRYTAKTTSAVVMYRIERAVLDQLLTEDQEIDESAIVEVTELEDDEDDSDWMTRLLSSELFTRLPHENIQKFFTLLEPLPADAGDVIVEQGSQGEYLYIVAEGSCSVNRVAPRSDKELQLAILKEGDTFGEESLISNSPCNASVKMHTPGFVMRLPKRNFEELVTKATIKPMTWSEACEQVEAGALWLDVRFSDEHNLNAIDGSQNIPLNTLRLESGKLDKDTIYVMYCDTGARSSTGAFLLARLGFEVYYLAGGLDRSPLGREAGVATDISQAKPIPKEAPPPAPSEPEAQAETSPAEDSGGFEFEIVSQDQPEAAPTDTPADPEPTAEPKEAPQAQAPSTDKTPAEKTAKKSAPAAKSAPSTGAVTIPAEVQEQLTTLRAERDKAAAFARKGSETVKEIKGRYEELRQAAIAERSRRETLERELADKQASAQRELELEQSRFSSELEKVRKKLEETELSATDADDQLQKLRAELQDSQQQNQSLEEAKVSFEVAYEDNLASLNEQIKEEQSKALKANEELAALRKETEAQISNTQQAISIKEAEASQLEQAVQSAESHLKEQKQELEAAQARFEEELKQAESKRNEAEANLRSEKVKLDSEAAVQEKRAASLDQREVDLQDDLAKRESEAAKREEALNQQELELSEERASWQTQIDSAIAKERERLEESFAEQNQASGLMDPEAAEALAEQRAEEVRAELEAVALATKADYESQLAGSTGSAEPQLAELRASYEAKLSEQEALLDDAQRQLEAENLHLRDALSEAQRVIKGLKGEDPAPSPKAEAKPEPAPDLDIDDALDALDELDGPDLELQLDTPEPQQVPETVVTAPEASETPAVPVIEIPEEPEPVVEEKVDAAKKGGKERVISPKQLAEIRKKMQEKLAAHKK